MNTRLLFLFLFFSLRLTGQTMEHPVEITVTPATSTVAPGAESAIIVSFKIPKGVWLGAEGSAARTPPATIIKMKPNSMFTYGDPQFPEPYTEGVPVKLGVTKVYKEMLQVVVPFTVNSSASDGDYPVELKTGEEFSTWFNLDLIDKNDLSKVTADKFRIIVKDTFGKEYRSKWFSTLVFQLKHS